MLLLDCCCSHLSLFLRQSLCGCCILSIVVVLLALVGVVVVSVVIMIVWLFLGCYSQF